METQHSQSSSSLPEGPKQQQSFHQEPSNSHEPQSESSQTYTQAHSSIGDRAAGQSVTTITEYIEAHQYQVACPYQHRQALTPDQHDFSHAGAWAAEPHGDTFVIENNPILSTIHRASAAMNTANRENAGPVGTEEAVELLRASLHRNAPKEQSTSTT